MTGPDRVALPSASLDPIARSSRDRIVLVGDSHLAKFDRVRQHRLRDAIGGAPLIVNRAFGGATSLDLQTDVEQGVFPPADTLVISVGTNDFAPWKQVPLDRFRAAMTSVLRSARQHRVIVLEPPTVDEPLQRTARPAQVRTREDRAPYVRQLTLLAEAAGVQVVTLPDAAVHALDGVHLNEHGYQVLIERLADALRTE